MAGLNYTNFEGGIAGPPFDAAAVVLDTPFACGLSRAIWVGGAGDITAVMASGNVALFKNVQVGWFSCAAKQVNSVGTTATLMTAGT
jgi:hypothetical protein